MIRRSPISATRERAQGKILEALIAHCKAIRSDPDCKYDAEIFEDITGLNRQVTWGINPGRPFPFSQSPLRAGRAGENEKALFEKAYDYMGYGPGMRMRDLAIQRVFIGSCSKGDCLISRKLRRWLRQTCSRGRRGADCLGLCGRQARGGSAGTEWHFHRSRFPVGRTRLQSVRGSNGERVAAGLALCVSTTNRNFIGRQGRDARTHLASR
jgi:3-isopropylmalate/(R)-2-methylmalate dehydratase large subunit